MDRQGKVLSFTNLLDEERDRVVEGAVPWGDGARAAADAVLRVVTKRRPAALPALMSRA